MKMDVEVLKQAVKNAKEKMNHSVLGFTEQEICKSCVGGQYFGLWILKAKMNYGKRKI